MGETLDLELDVIGRKTKPVQAEVLRELTQSDIALLATERGVKPSHIQRLGERHHALARCLASGLSISDACAITGYTPSRVSVLKGDPSFEELIAFYQGDKAKLVQDLGHKLTSIALDSANILQERLEDNPDSFGPEDLRDNIKLGADRTGFGPQSKSTSLHVHMNFADRLEAERRRSSGAGAEGRGKLIEGSLAPTISPGGKDANDK